jgi:hypothetical protein
MNLPALHHCAAGDLAAGDRHQGKRLRQRGTGDDQSGRADAVCRAGGSGDEHGLISNPSAPLGFRRDFGAAAASIFFAYVGFDAVSTAAEETKNPQRNMPIGLIGIACDLHRLLPAGRSWRDRRGGSATAVRCRRHRACPGQH